MLPVNYNQPDVNGPHPNTSVSLADLIQQLERSALDGVTPDEFELAPLLDDLTHSFFHIRGLADFWSEQQEIDFLQHMTDLVIGAHRQYRTDVTLVLAGTAQKLSVYISLGDEATTQTLLTGIFAGIDIEPVPVRGLAQQLRLHFQTKGVITGIPSRKTGRADPLQPGEPSDYGRNATMSSKPDTQHSVQLERVIRGMFGTTWAYIVQATPYLRKDTASARTQIINKLTEVASQTHIKLENNQNKVVQVSKSGSESSSSGIGTELVNYQAQYLVQLMERELERLNQAMAEGQWQVGIYFGASNAGAAQRLASLLLSVLNGKDSRPEAVRAFICQRGKAYLQKFKTNLSSNEVAQLIQLPREEVPGYAIHDFVLFDTDINHSNNDTNMLALGNIQQNGQNIPNIYDIPLDDLAKHAVVVGVTGSGKTTTVMNLLDRLINERYVKRRQLSFLIIEPAKHEYRALFDVFKDRSYLRIYTLGNEMAAPFRLNPFEFETDDKPGRASVLTHIDFLKAVFNAAFILYAPMPYVLDTALHEIYEDKGWDLASGLNTRLSEDEWKNRHRYPIFPTLTDLYHKIDVVTNRLGYHDEIERNVKAGLKARIDSLRIGSKGLMLDTPRGISMQKLLSLPTLLEMERIGNDDEKTFLPGLLLARIYEYRRLQDDADMLPKDTNFQHLIVFEEAHRLLKNTSTEVDVESSNLCAQAIDMFTNILSEIRAYKQGILVAEQIPSKLAPDVMKNTNLKIVHRLLAQDDREVVGQTMNLSNGQLTHLSVLSTGVAIVYAEGADHAYQVHFEKYSNKSLSTTNERIRSIVTEFKSAAVSEYLSVPDIDKYEIPLTVYGGPDPTLYQDAGRLLEKAKSHTLWAEIILRAVHNPSQLPDSMALLQRFIMDEFQRRKAEQQQIIKRLFIVRGCAEQLDQRGAKAGWSYAEVDEMRLHLTYGLLSMSEGKAFSTIPHNLTRFASLYQAKQRQEGGPFVGCTSCLSKCLYRSEVQLLVSPTDRKYLESDLKSNGYHNNDARYSAIANKSRAIALRWLGGDDKKRNIIVEVAYCEALHALAQAGYREHEQQLFSDLLAPGLLS